MIFLYADDFQVLKTDQKSSRSASRYAKWENFFVWITVYSTKRADIRDHSRPKNYEINLLLKAPYTRFKVEHMLYITNPTVYNNHSKT